MIYSLQVTVFYFTYIATIFLVWLTGFKLNYEEYDTFPNTFAQPQTTLRLPLAEKHWSGLAKHYLHRFIYNINNNNYYYFCYNLNEQMNSFLLQT